MRSLAPALLFALAAALVPVAWSGTDPTADSGPNTRAMAPAYSLLADIAYGSAPRQRFDVYLPTPPAPGGKAPMIVMVHGGAWMVGRKNSDGVVGNKVERWVRRGFVFVSVDYRMLPEADPLAQAQDVATALAAVQQQAPGWGADPSRLVLMGHSAGAHLVALLGAAPATARAAGATPWRATIALDSAALDLPGLMRRRHLRFYDRVFGSDPAYWTKASPIDNVAPDATPMLLVCSTQRPDQPCAQSRTFAARMPPGSAAVLEQDLNHAQVNAQLGLPGGYTDAVESWLAGIDPALARQLGR